MLMQLPCKCSLSINKVQMAMLSTTPPSTRKAAPVVAEDSGEAMYATRLRDFLDIRPRAG